MARESLRWEATKSRQRELFSDPCRQRRAGIRDAMGHKSINSTTVYASLGIGSDHGLKSPLDMEGYDPMADYLIRDAFQTFYADYRSRNVATPEQESAAWCIMQCKTGQLGFSESTCPKCGYRWIHYASCGNRNCPNCQGTKPAEWIEARSSELIEGLP